jgi:monoamine oxidase
MPRRVIIIGGGIAGLTAASELHDCQVTLLEAKPRFGGRIHSLRLPGGLIELGAEFVHGQSKTLLRAIHSAQLTTRDVSDQNQVLLDGRLQESDIWEQFEKLMQRIDTQSRDCSFFSFLNQQTMDEPTRKMMLGFATGFNAAHADRISAHSLKRAEYSAEQMEGDKQSRIDQGYGALVDFLTDKAREAGATLFSDASVRSIHWEHGQVDVEAIHETRATTFNADAAIVTLPLGVLKAREVTFSPALPDKDEAIDGLEFGNVLKVILIFRKPWWPVSDFGFIHSLDEAIPTWWSDPRGPILTGWAGGAKADALVEKSEEELEQLALETLARIFSLTAGHVRVQLMGMRTYNWAEDPHVRGAYSYIPVDGLFLPKQLGAPVEQTLYFAGEATAQDAQMGTVFGAMESGKRAANEVTADVIAPAVA